MGFMASFLLVLAELMHTMLRFTDGFAQKRFKILRRIAIAVVNIGQEKIKAT